MKKIITYAGVKLSDIVPTGMLVNPKTADSLSTIKIIALYVSIMDY